jgi:soluble lytic murein transglycosylase
VRVETAERLLFYGDYEAALREFTATYESASPDEVRAAALLGMARSQWALSQPQAALDNLQSLIANFPASPNLPEAWFFIGEISFEAGSYAAAADAYSQYLALRPGILDAVMHTRRGDALLLAGRAFEAVDAYTIALNSPQLPGGEEALKIKIADSLGNAGDAATALALYTELYAASPNDLTKASLLIRRADMLNLLGEVEGGFALYHEAIALYPRAPDAYAALLRLLDAGREVNELHRGLVDYYAGEYSLAVFAFDRYLTGDPAHDGTAHHYKALSLRAIDNYDAALAEWSELIQTHHPGDAYWDDAWEEIADTHWAFRGDPAAGIAAYLDFAARVPDHPRAAEFIFYAAQVAERSGDLPLAAQLWERVDTSHPLDPNALRARFLAGITRYRLGEYSLALGNFQLLVQKASAPLDASQAWFWLGKTHFALGDAESANAAFAQAAQADPTGYYSVRAGETLAGRSPFAAPPAPADFSVDWAAERALAEGWLRVNFSLPEEVQLPSPGALAGDARFVRGSALWRLGWYDEARLEFESLRLDIQSDPADNYRLANYLLDLGLYRTAIFCARQVLTLAGMDDAATLHAPPWFSHVRFGAYYAELVLPAAEREGFDPRLVYAVLRQESLFEGFVRSTAGARGLMQIIPETGQAIADNLGWPPGYTAADLYRPLVSVTFGVDYLASQRNYFAAGEPPEAIDLYAALAAYNGGPGNSNAWLLQADPDGDGVSDPDLFLEIIRFDETRRYLRGVYELWAIYGEVWGR